jgi:transposase-like protein
MYSAAEKQKALEGLATWPGTLETFAQAHGLSKTTLYEWKKGSRAKGGRKKAKTQRSFTADQRRQAVEAFEKSGQGLQAFAKAWGLHERVLGRWVKAYRTDGPKALAGKKTGRKLGKAPVAPALREGIKKVKAEFPDFGLRKVQGFLARFKGLKASPPVIRRVVKEEALPPGRSAPKRWKKTPLPRRFERSKPGELWQTDITSFNLARHSQKVYLVAFMDDYSRYVVSWRLGLQQTTDFVQEALLEGIQRFGKPKELLSDQGRQYHTWRGTSSFRQLLDRQGIKHVLSRPKHPQTVGKCERFWKTVGFTPESGHLA